MKTYYEHAGSTIYHGDCREILPTLPRFDLLLTDPPYGQSYKAPSPRNKKAPGLNGNWVHRERSTSDSVTGDGEAVDVSWLPSVADNSVIWGAHKLAHQLPPGSWLVWDKKVGLTSNDFGDGEAAWTSRDQPLRIFRFLWNGLCIQSDSAEAKRKRGTSEALQRLHPTQKPVALMKWCLMFFPTAKTVLDPYCGSGTTLRAAKDAGLTAVGIEREEKYCEIAAKRMAQQVMEFV